MSTHTTLPEQPINAMPASTDETPVETAEVRGELPIGHQQVDPTAAEAFISEKRIGERIKHLRLKKSMGLVELGRHTGLSASFLSQLETGRVVPTLRNLARIAMVFSKDLNYFFEPEPQTLFRVHRGKDRVRLPQSGVDDPAYYFESLGYMVPERHLDPYFAEFLPKKAGREVRAHQHTGCEFLYLLGGQLDVRHGDTVYHVEPGDAVYFDANTIHSYTCASPESATALIVTMQQPGAGRHSSGSVRRNSDALGRKTADPVDGNAKAKRVGLAPVPLSGRPH
jgi:transcriptional regulator with XRE-family HTH domain